MAQTEYQKWVWRINTLRDLWANPCAPNPEAWAYAAVEALPKMFAGIFKPFPAAETWHELTKRYHTKKFPFSYREMARRLGIDFAALEELELAEPWSNKLAWKIFTVSGDWAFRLGWYLLLADVTTDALINWVSLAHQYEGCPVHTEPFAQGISETGIITGSGPRNDYIFQGWIVTGQNEFQMDDASIVTARDADPTVNFSISTIPNPFGFPDATWEAWLEDEISGFKSDIIQPGADSAGGSTASFMHWGGLIGVSPHKYVVKYNKSEGLMWLNSGQFNAYGAEGRNIKPDP